MSIWQIDFDHIPLQPRQKKNHWELVICDSKINSSDNLGSPLHTAQCTLVDANSDWLEKQLILAAQGKFPTKIQLFRPEIKNLVTVAASNLSIEVEATRHTPTLKKILSQRHQANPLYNPFTLDKVPPQALPEAIWGDEWQIANIAAGQIVDLFSDRPIPILSLPEDLFPINLGIASDIPIPGLVVFGGRQSMQLARWVNQNKPAFINYIATEAGKSGGFVLETGLVDRWIFSTFESTSAAKIATAYEQKKQASQGLHFLLIQPDESGMTTTAFWLLSHSI